MKIHLPIFYLKLSLNEYDMDLMGMRSNGAIRIAVGKSMLFGVKRAVPIIVGAACA